VSDSKLRVGVVGAGVAFRALHLPRMARHRSAVSVAGIVTRSDASAQSAAQLVEETLGERPAVFESVGALLASAPDAVLVNVPIDATRVVAHQVLDAGVHLICEKPLGESALEAAEIVTHAETAGVTLAVCENFRYQERFHRVREMVEDGAIGDPKVYFLNDLHYTSPDGMYSVRPWRQRGDHRGGYLLDGGSHIMAGLRAMVGETPSSAFSLPASFHPDHLGRPWDTALVNLSFDSGLVGHLALGYGSPDREARHPKVLGTDGTVVLKKDRIEPWRADSARDEVIELPSVSDGIDEEWDDFVQVLASGGTLRYSPWEAVDDLAVLDAILESADRGEAVSVAQSARA